VEAVGTNLPYFNVACGVWVQLDQFAPSQMDKLYKVDLQGPHF